MEIAPGWKTYIGVAAAIAYAIGGLVGGYIDIDTAIGVIVAAWTAAGLRAAISKVEKKR